VDDLLRKLEEQRGVSGYMLVESAMEQVSSQKEQVDATKGSMLEEISRLAVSIKQRVAEMSPILEQLRSVRTEFADVETEHRRAKAKFATEAAGFTARRSRLEKEADTLLSDAIATEQQYQQLLTMIDVVDSRLKRAEDERSFRAKEAALLRDIPTHKQLIEETLSRSERLASVFLARQREIAEHSTEHAVQKRIFEGLAKVMEARCATVAQEQEAFGNGGVDIMEVGGANVMTIE
jgi:chromosome segregation ATPase